MPRNKYPEETVKKILDASLQLFVEKGYEQTTVLDIVGNLGGLTRGAFYHHFKSKEEVLEAIFDINFEDFQPFIKARQATVANGLERLKLAIKLSLKANLENEQRRAMSNLALSLASNPRFVVEQIKANQRVAEVLTPMIEEGMADGSIRPGNAKIIAELFMLLANFWLFPSYFPCAVEESYVKVMMVKEIFDGMGCLILDEEMGEIFAKVYDVMDW